jgi:glutathione S-transferase
MKLYDAPYAPNPFTVRLFIAERGGITLDVELVDLGNLENRSPTFRAINPFGTVPALLLDDGSVLSDIIAICEYVDEVAIGGRSLIGLTPDERAHTRMWTRRVDHEIAQPVANWWRGSDEAIEFYRGHRVPQSGGRLENKLSAMQGLNLIDDTLQDLDFLGGSMPAMADILLFAFISGMQIVTPWLLPPGRRNVAAWFERMEERPAVTMARQVLPRIGD